MLTTWRKDLRRASEYGVTLGYKKHQVYQGLAGLVVVAVVFAAAAVYMITIGDMGAAAAAGVGAILMLGVVVWRVKTWSRKGSGE